MEYNKTYPLRTGDLRVDSLSLKLKVGESEDREGSYHKTLIITGYNPYRFKLNIWFNLFQIFKHLYKLKKQGYRIWWNALNPQNVKYFVRTKTSLRYDNELTYADLSKCQVCGGTLQDVVPSLKGMDWALTLENNGITLKMPAYSSLYKKYEVRWTEEALQCVTTKCEPEPDIPSMQACDTVCTNLNQDRSLTLPYCQ